MSRRKKVTAILRRLSTKGLGIPRRLDWIGPSSRFHRHNFKTRHNFKRNLQCWYHNMLLLLAQSIRAWICVARILQMSRRKKVTAILRRLSTKGLGIPRRLDWIGPSSRFHRHNFKTRHNFKRNLQCWYHNMLLLLAQSIRAWICVARRMGSWCSLIMGSGGLYQDYQSGSFLLTASLLSLVNFIC